MPAKKFQIKIRSKLILGFTGVILFTAAVSIFSVSFITRSRFHEYSHSADLQYAESIAPVLGDFYAAAGGWSGVESALVTGENSSQWSMGNMRSGMMMGNMMQGRTMGRGTMRASTMQMMMWIPPTSRVVVADLAGIIVIDTMKQLYGETLDNELISAGIPLLADGTERGALFVGSMIDATLNPLERNFYRSVFIAILITMAIAVLLAFAFSSAFVSRISNPILELDRAAKEISAGDLSTRVETTGNDEIHGLAESFNYMSASLEKADEKRRQMVADIAHEIRTPLSLIRGNLEAIIDSVYPLNMESINGIHEQTLFLGRIVEDLRTLSLLDSGALSLDIQQLEPASIVDYAIRSFEQKAGSKHITLNRSVNDSPKTAKADIGRIHQVMANLLSNAIRHTPEHGEISVGLTLLNHDTLRFFVKDSGFGMSQTDCEHVFERFYRADRSRNRNTGGSGLGLAISKKVVEAHKGEIGVESAPRSGSTFWFTIPV